MKCSPAWSLAPRHSPKAAEQSPGPGSYDTSLSKAPGFTVPAAKRSHLLSVASAPGPGTYSTLKPSFSDPKPGFRFGSGSRPPIAYENGIPGPGAYRVEGSPSGPKYVFPGRGIVEKDSESPGPGQYQPSLSPKATDVSPFWSFGKDNRVYYRSDRDIPGPGNYEVRKGFIGRGTVFGHEKRGKTDYSEAPGPGAYSHTVGSERKSGFSMSFRHTIRSSWEGSPGPDAYDLSKAIGSEKGFPQSKAVRSPQQVASSIPGPGAYNLALRETVSVPGIRTGNRLPIAMPTPAPGPGAYSPALKPSGPEYGMKGRHKIGEIQVKESPGPGQYSPGATARGKDSVPNWSFGKDTKAAVVDNRNQREVPGPGVYNVKPPPTIPRWSFGHEIRGKATRPDSPGPGAYEVKATIPSVPSYLLAT